MKRLRFSLFLRLLRGICSFWGVLELLGCRTLLLSALVLFLFSFLGLVETGDVAFEKIGCLVTGSRLVAIACQRNGFLAAMIHLNDFLGSLGCDGLKVDSQTLVS